MPVGALSAIRSAVVAAAVLCLIGVPVGAAAATDEGQDGPDVPPRSLGAVLDWSSDTAAEQASRLGSAPAVYENSVPLPVTPDAFEDLDQFIAQAAGQGSAAVVAVRPTVPLGAIDSAAAEEFAVSLRDALGARATPVLVEFAPEMNAPWVRWGAQPEAYVTAFRAVAAAVEDTMPGTAMVWTPAQGDDYPFQAARPAADHPALDTDGDGSIGSADDPYGPYFPGQDVVDWVGLSVYHDDSAGGAPVNTVPAPTELTDRIGDAGAGFYGDYAERFDLPMLIETAAFYSGSAAGASEAEVKRPWWGQVFDALTDPAREKLRLAIWRDGTATRGGVAETIIDWSATLSPRVRDAFAADLRNAGLSMAPIYPPEEGGAQGGGDTGTVLPPLWSWVVVAAVALAAVTLFLLALRGRRRADRVYRGPGSRDLRIDWFRGLAIVFVVVNHLGLMSLLQTGTQEAIGVVSGAELFVLLSGSVLGIVYRPKVAAGGIGEVVLRTGRRAWKLYVTALVVVVLVFLLSRLPFVDAGAVTTFTDEGTGGAGTGASGRVYDLYAGAGSLLQYPADPRAVLDFALLRDGPWQFNVMGLYVVLLIVSPLVLWALSRRRWLPVVAVSTGLWLLEWFTRIRLLPSQFEDSFPLLSWQLLFVAGMVAGYHRREIVAWFKTRTGVGVLAVVCTLAVVSMLFSWSSPYVSSALDVRLDLLDANAHRAVYQEWFGRTYLGAGRLLAVAVFVVAGYALLTAYWKPVGTLTGWFFVPLGQATLYVFVLHVFFALLVANIPGLDSGGVWLATAANLAVLALLWVMVRTRFLFRIVPR
jgi:hypothetical protein